MGRNMIEADRIKLQRIEDNLGLGLCFGGVVGVGQIKHLLDVVAWSYAEHDNGSQGLILNIHTFGSFSGKLLNIDFEGADSNRNGRYIAEIIAGKGLLEGKDDSAEIEVRCYFNLMPYTILEVLGCPENRFQKACMDYFTHSVFKGLKACEAGKDVFCFSELYGLNSNIGKDIITEREFTDWLKSVLMSAGDSGGKVTGKGLYGYFVRGEVDGLVECLESYLLSWSFLKRRDVGFSNKTIRDILELYGKYYNIFNAFIVECDVVGLEANIKGFLLMEDKVVELRTKKRS